MADLTDTLAQLIQADELTLKEIQRQIDELWASDLTVHKMLDLHRMYVERIDRLNSMLERERRVRM